MNDFIVKGSGIFPYTMLSRGKCYPKGEVDVDKMFSYSNSRTINLTGDGQRQNEDLWRSFGWTVISSSAILIKDEYEHYHTWPC